MNSKNLKILAGIVAVLLALYLFLDRSNVDRIGDDKLLPALKSQINDVNRLVVASGGETTTIENTAGEWTVNERGNYAADVGTLRTLLIALAEAKILEVKTSDPDKYHLLAVEGPDSDESESIQLTVSGADLDYNVILGKSAQTNFRYARLGDAAQSVLIDRNPDIPTDAGGWLRQEILDIEARRIERVTITHPDGERLQIQKDSEDATDFQLNDIPVGRELSYATAANGIGGVLSGLTLDDVRTAVDADTGAATTASFDTFDGLTITIASVDADDDTSWLSITASAVVTEQTSAETVVEVSADTTDEAQATDETNVTGEAQAINRQLAGWQFRIPDYKSNLLKRRTEDILKPLDEE